MTGLKHKYDIWLCGSAMLEYQNLIHVDKNIISIYLMDLGGMISKLYITETLLCGHLFLYSKVFDSFNQRISKVT